MLWAITHQVSPRLGECELTFHTREPIDLALAARQHAAYCRILERLGARVERLTANSEYPDSCFVEDTAVVFEELAVICSPGAESRRGETALIAAQMAKHREVTAIELPATIDGGDVLQVGKSVFVGRSRRTNQQGIERLGALLTPYGYRVEAVETNGSLHLKSACTAIDERTLFVNPRWVDTAPLARFELLPTPLDEPAAANVLRVGEVLCLAAGFPRSAELLASRVPRLELVEISELRKAEAGLTCSSLIFESSYQIRP
jgi:dimethylargininase